MSAITIVLSLAVSAVAGEKPATVRVLTYNIHHGEGVDRKLDLERIAKVINAVKPDLVALQEVDRKTKRTGGVDQAKRLSKLTKLRMAYGANIKFQGGEYGNAILSRWKISKQKNVLLPNSDGEQRGVIVAEIARPGMKEPLIFLATHLDHRRPDGDRLRAAKTINVLIAGYKQRPAILAGDLNDVPSSRVLKEFGKTWRIGWSKERPTIPVARPTRQIDFILHRPAERWKVVDMRVLKEATASDHRALLAVFELR